MAALRGRVVIAEAMRMDTLYRTSALLVDSSATNLSLLD